MLPARALALLCLAGLPFARSATTNASDPKSGEALLSQMHDRYAGKWYPTLTFVQQTTRPGQPVSTWYEAAKIPGRLRIDVAPVDSGNAFMYVGDSVHSFQHHQPGRSGADRNLLLTLGFDVYGQPATVTADQLKAEKVDLSRIRTDTWDGKAVWVVGADKGDTTSSQFWVEKDRLLFVRLLQPIPARDGSTRMLDARFNKYQRLGGGWLAMNCVILAGGKPLQEEDYSDPRGDRELPDSLFDPKAYHRPAWIP